ncbi:LPXTG cell wall anchor domain-containing protein, partial [Streptomyces sp. SID4982]|uniref:LPXTG cell wall anchor domain-containing protein n=2 Tax=unclassified Streptomyces TaxID=2593676 RepID=UPI00136EE2AC
QSAPAQAGAVTTPPPADLEPQAVGNGGLAETGANLWPAALGVLLAASGLVMLLRARRLRY